MFPVPPNEALRLQRVQQSGILDSEFQTQFDALVAHASEIFGVPISLITILDRNRQWFKAVHGLEVRETLRESAFCNYPVAAGQRHVVADTAHDRRFDSNNLANEAGIRFYAGVPLALEPGVHAGTLCILDTKPRRLSETALATLDRLGRIAEALIQQFVQARELSQLSGEVNSKNLLLAQQNAELLVKQQLLEDACRLANMGAWERDLTTGRYLWSSKTLLALHGIEDDHEITDETIRQFYSDAEWARLSKTVEQAYKDHEPYEIELEFFTAQGERRHARVSSAVEFGSDGAPIRRFGLKQDITAEREAREALRRLAETDMLTGLANRSTLLARMSEHRANGTPVCVMMFDLDGFKDVNDTSGHDAGDACLREIARRVAAIPMEACIARLGGDEFAILVPASDELHMSALAAWVLRELSKPFIWEEQGFQLSVSIGIAHSLERASVDPAVLMTEADLALYAAKAKGKNRHEFFYEAMRKEATDKVSTLARARDASNRREFLLHYQPKFLLADCTIVGLEALLRWQEGSVLRAPGEFRAALEDPVLSREIGAFVIEEAFNQAGEWLTAGTDFCHIAVNMSPQQFQTDCLVEEFMERLARHGLAPHHIQLEITEETVLSKSADEVREVCLRLREEGIRIAFDDFGTGFASLTHLIEFPVDIIKIDRNFVGRLAEDGRARAVVASIVGLARNLELEVVAEGVETETQRDLLIAMGCDIAQGHLVSPAVPASTLFHSKAKNAGAPTHKFAAPDLPVRRW